MPVTRMRPRRLLGLTCLVAAIGGGAYWAVDSWRDQAELARAESDMESARRAPSGERPGYFSRARDRLARLSARRPGRDEVDYRLGTCEAALGHFGPALEAWGRVPAGSALAAVTTLDRARLALEHGRLAVAEEALARIAGEPGEVGKEARGLADQVDLYLGRVRPISRRIERRWTSAADLDGQLRLHWLLESQPMPVDPVREALDRFASEAPDDDRVWLARAVLAGRTGRLDEADTWLAKCEARRPDDPEVLRERLNWALDAGRPEAAARAAPRLPADRFEPADVASIEARLADLRGDAEAERRALERLAELRPGDASAWGRLAELAARAGRAERSAECRRRKAEIDRDRDAYRMLMEAAQIHKVAESVDLARLAERLGRRFEARSWWSMRLREAPDDSEARAAVDRLAPLARQTPPRGTLADLIPGLAGGPGRSRAGGAGGGPSVPTFVDLAESSGLRFVYDQDQSPMRRLPETMGGGLGLIDYDGDGRLDVYVVQGGPFPGGSTGPSGGDRLFRNKGDGTFEDATERANIASFPRGYGHGVTVGDYDGDGHPDLFVTRWRAYALYRNKGDGTFEDATERAGLAGPRGWPTSSAFADLDGDGDLDLYVCHYLKWNPETSPPASTPSGRIGTPTASPRPSPPSPTVSTATTGASSST